MAIEVAGNADIVEHQSNFSSSIHLIETPSLAIELYRAARRSASPKVSEEATT